MFSFKRATLTWYDVRVGLFIVLGISTMIIAILVLQPGRHLGGSLKVRSIFATVGGLTPGSPVTISGVQIGTVTNLRIIRSPSEVPSNGPLLKELQALKQEMDRIDVSSTNGHKQYQKLLSTYSRTQSQLKHVSVLMEVSASQKDLIGSTSIAQIKNQGLVGEKYIEISTAGPDAAKLSPVVDSTGVSAIEIRGQEPVDINAVLQNAAGAAGSMEDLISEVDNDITQGKGTLGKLIKDPSVHNNLNATLKETARATKYSGDLMQSIKKGKGTIGKLFSDPSLFNSTNKVMVDVEHGNGSLGKLIHDPTLYNNSQSAIKKMNDFVSRANDGPGTVSKLVRDPALYQNANRMVVSASSMLTSAKEGKGTFGKLTIDDSLYINSNNAMKGLAEVTEKVNQGQGTIGLLLKDRRIYDNFYTFSEELVNFIKDVRKNPKKYLTLQINVLKLF